MEMSLGFRICIEWVLTFSRVTFSMMRKLIKISPRERKIREKLIQGNNLGCVHVHRERGVFGI